MTLPEADRDATIIAQMEACNAGLHATIEEKVKQILCHSVFAGIMAMNSPDITGDAEQKSGSQDWV